MINFHAAGNTLAFTAGSALSSGAVHQVGTLIGVLAADVASGEVGILNLTGVFGLPKVGSQAWAVGDLIYWNGAAATKLAAAGILLGAAHQAVGSGAGAITGYVRLNGIADNAGLGMVAGFSMAAAAAGANVSEVTVTALDAAGNVVAAPVLFDLWLSDATTGAGLTATAASGTVTAKAASGAVIGTLEAKKALRVQALATGAFILAITDTAKTAFKVCAAVPGTGRTVVGVTLATASYG